MSNLLSGRKKYQLQRSMKTLPQIHRLYSRQRVVSGHKQRKNKQQLSPQLSMKGYIYDRKGYPRHFENISNQQHTSHYFMSNNTQQRLEQHLFFFFVFRVWTIRRGQLYWSLGNGPTCNSCTDVYAMCLRSLLLLLLWIGSVLAIQRQCQPCQTFFVCSSGNLWSWDSVNNDGVWLVPNSHIRRKTVFFYVPP